MKCKFCEKETKNFAKGKILTVEGFSMVGFYYKLFGCHIHTTDVVCRECAIKRLTKKMRNLDSWTEVVPIKSFKMSIFEKISELQNEKPKGNSIF